LLFISFFLPFGSFPCRPSTIPTTVRTNIPTESPTTIPTAIPTYVPSFSPTFSPTNSPSFVPTEVPTSFPTEFPTVSPTTPPTDTPTESPTTTPTYLPTYTPTFSPTEVPTHSPTEEPTESPTHSPTEGPSYYPTITPTYSPTEIPTSTPTELPTASPTYSPTVSPSSVPTVSPSLPPTNTPTVSPTEEPTDTPSYIPTDIPTVIPSQTPTRHPTTVGETETESPTESPTENPSDAPSETPSETPSEMPSEQPSEFPTEFPSEAPTVSPSSAPSGGPSKAPSQIPSEAPSAERTREPTVQEITPSDIPTHAPSSSVERHEPSRFPSLSPVATPSEVPTDSPSFTPTIVHTDSPVASPTRAPTTFTPTFTPSVIPTRIPSTAGPTRNPSFKPSYFTQPPTTATPTSSSPVLSFTSDLTLAGFTSPELGPKDEIAVINATATSMGISSIYVAITNTVATAVGSNAIIIRLQKQFQLRKRQEEEEEQEYRRRLSVTYTIVVTTETKIPLAVFGITDPTAFYTQLQTALKTAVTSGSFSQTLQAVAKAIGADNAAGVNITSFTSSPPVVTIGYVPQPSPNDDTYHWTEGGIAGITIGSVAFATLLVAGVYFYHTRYYKPSPKIVALRTDSFFHGPGSGAGDSPLPSPSKNTRQKPGGGSKDNNGEYDDQAADFADIYPEDRENNISHSLKLGVDQQQSGRVEEQQSPLQRMASGNNLSPKNSPVSQRSNNNTSSNKIRFQGYNPLAPQPSFSNKRSKKYQVSEEDHEKDDNGDKEVEVASSVHVDINDKEEKEDEKKNDVQSSPKTFTPREEGSFSEINPLRASKSRSGKSKSTKEEILFIETEDVSPQQQQQQSEEDQQINKTASTDPLNLVLNALSAKKNVNMENLLGNWNMDVINNSLPDIPASIAEEAEATVEMEIEVGVENSEKGSQKDENENGSNPVSKSSSVRDSILLSDNEVMKEGGLLQSLNRSNSNIGSMLPSAFLGLSPSQKNNNHNNHSNNSSHFDMNDDFANLPPGLPPSPGILPSISPKKKKLFLEDFRENSMRFLNENPTLQPLPLPSPTTGSPRTMRRGLSYGGDRTPEISSQIEEAVEEKEDRNDEVLDENFNIEKF
jgi:hypothetical protein